MIREGDNRTAPSIGTMTTLEDALLLAALAHMGQTRKGTTEPYVLHPIRVMLRFTHERPAHRVVAVLHDVVEDTLVMLEQIARDWRGNPAVVPALDAITRREDESHRDYINRCETDDIAVSVKLADLQDNMRDPWWCPPGMLARYTRDYQQLHTAALERHLLVP
jgi:(p)ppGpp synthase/HD superfamily hydrolase